MDYFHSVNKWFAILICPEVLIPRRTISLLPMVFRKDSPFSAKYLFYTRRNSSKKKCHIVTESPCYSGAWHLFNYYGAAVTPVAVDRQGICTDKLPECNTQLCYVTPAHQYPLGYTLSLARREALLSWALRVGAYIIEDDYDAVFTYSDNPLPALKAMDYHDRVIYTGTFSKTLGPRGASWLPRLPGRTAPPPCKI